MSVINIPKDADIIIVDLSYYVFYRYYAIINWLKNQTENIDIEDIINNDIFISKYTKMFEKVLNDLSMNYQVVMKNIYIVCDCQRDTIWRFTHFSNYKDNRDHGGRFNGKIFDYTYNTLLPKLVEKYKFQVIRESNLEADDVINIIVKYVRKCDIKSNITVITNDNDYIQILKNDFNTAIYNLQGMEIKDRVKCDPDTYLKLKILIGDKSDNIPNIGKKVGIKTAEKFVKDPELLNEYFIKNPAAKLQYELNRLLIDFSYIPNNFIEYIESKIEIT